MSDQSTDPAPQEDPTLAVTDPVRAEAFAADNNPSNELVDAEGNTVVIGLDPMGAPTEVVEVRESTAAVPVGTDALPNAEYGFRPEPVPGPTIEQINAMSVEGYTPGPTAQEIIMNRAHAQADAIVKAAEDAVAAMDAAEADSSDG